MTSVDVVVVGGGTVGGCWATFLREEGSRSCWSSAARQSGAACAPRAWSGRRAGPSRSAAGAVDARLLSRPAGPLRRRLGFVETGYYMPCFTEDEVQAVGARIAMQQSLGLAAEWVTPDELDRRNPIMAPGKTRGASYFSGDGYIDPPRNVAAYAAALAASGVQVWERTTFTGLLTGGDRVTGADEPRGAT
ncbi:MAG: FAD-dependent oxidoreductase [Nocardioidaceae bacterium]